jgi:CMP-N-acetylneuraminic acid synthetase
MKKLEKLKILSLIPARSGSKSIKNKNIIPYKGKPLIYHTIKAAIKFADFRKSCRVKHSRY